MNCKQCRWYKPLYVSAEKPTDRGECHLNPPVVIRTGESIKSVYPTVFDNNSCGRFADINTVNVGDKFGIVEKSPISMTANAGTGGRVLTKESCSYRVYLDPVTGEEIPESIVFCPGDTLTSDTPEPKWNRHGCSADPGFHHEHLEETRKAIAELGVQK